MNSNEIPLKHIYISHDRHSSELCALWIGTIVEIQFQPRLYLTKQ